MRVYPTTCSAVLLLLLTLAIDVTAQESRCTARLADLTQIAELRGFRLGMTFDQVKARVPQVKFGPTDDLGVSKTTINPDFDPRIDQTTFEDVRTVSLDFLDGRLISLWLGYKDTFKWRTLDEFIKGISQSIAVPDRWITKGRGQQIKCVDFEASASMIAGGPSLRLVELAGEETIAARRQTKADEAEAKEAAEAETPVIGDSRNKVYYAGDCEGLKAVPEKNRVTFNSIAEAEKAGYKHAANRCAKKL
jgi:hypothetical protein